MVVNARVTVGVLLRPQLAFRRPVARPLLQVALHQFAQPLGGHELGCADFPPVRVDDHGRPLGQLAPRHRPKLRFRVGRDNAG